VRECLLLNITLWGRSYPYRLRFFFLACNGKPKSWWGWSLGLHPVFRCSLLGARSDAQENRSESISLTIPGMSRRLGCGYWGGLGEVLIWADCISFWRWGDKGDSGEDSIHPKPPSRSINQSGTFEVIQKRLEASGSRCPSMADHAPE
jgi:hypothetical protein